MAAGKKSFVLYADYIHTFDLLTSEQSGRLIKHIFDYVNDKNPEFSDDDILLKIAFEPIKRQLKRDLLEWDSAINDRSIAGRLGNLKRWHKELYQRVIKNEISLEEAEQLSHNRKATNAIANIANIAVNVNDNVTVNDTVTDIVEDKSSTPDGGDEKDKNEVVGIKPAGLKKNVEPKKKIPRKKKGKNPDSEPYWHLIRKKWIWFNKTHLKFNVEPIPTRDYSHMHRIIEKLRERAVGQAVEWTEKNAIDRWEKFLTIAFTKDDWLPKNFLLGNLESKMQKIFNLIDNPHGQQKTGRQGSTTSTVGKTIEFDRP